MCTLREIGTGIDGHQPHFAHGLCHRLLIDSLPLTMQLLSDFPIPVISTTWLMTLALTTDNGVALVDALVQEMRTQTLIPGITTLERLAWEVRRRARCQVYQWLAGD